MGTVAPVRRGKQAVPFMPGYSCVCRSRASVTEYLVLPPLFSPSVSILVIVAEKTVAGKASRYSSASWPRDRASTSSSSTATTICIFSWGVTVHNVCWAMV